MQISKLLSIVLLGASAVAAQHHISGNSTNSTAPNTPAGNSSATLAELLTNPSNNLNVTKFVDFIQSDSGYQPIIELLSQPGNYTCFIPDDRAMNKLSSVWKSYAKANNLNATTYPPSNFSFAVSNSSSQNLSVIDVVNYHILNGTVQVANMSNYVNVAYSLLNNTEVDHLETGLPVLIKNNATWEEFNNATWLQNNSQYIKYEVGNGTEEVDIRYHDIQASNGYANIINYFLLPPMSPSVVIEQVDEVGSLADLLKEHVELATLLNDTRNFTFFAPNDKALKEIDFENMDNDTIKSLISNHLVEGVYYSTNITANATENNGYFNLTTLTNITLPIFVNGSNITINDTAHVVEPNVFFNNGVMHVIDRLINATTPDAGNATTQASGSSASEAPEATSSSA